MSNFIKKVVTGFATSALVMGSLVVSPLTAAAASAGEVYKTTDGTVWFITNDAPMQRRPFTSWGAFQSYGFLSQGMIKDATSDVTALTAGSFVAPRDGSIFCASETKGSDVKGECALITGGMKAAFTSATVFTGQGFSFARAKTGDSSFLSKTANIDNASASHVPGVLVNNSGTVQLVVAGGLWGIPSIDVFNSWGWSFADVVPANGADKTMTQTGVITARTAGQLNPSATVNPNPSGSITVSLGSNNPASATVPLGATNVKMLNFNISNASSSAVTVSQVTVHRDGAGSSADLSNVYLYQGSMRLTSGRSVNSSTNDAVFSGLNLTIPANGSIALDVLADINTSGTGNVHRLAVNNVVLASGTASGSATGNTFTLAAVSAGTITISKSGSITNPKVGATNVKIGEFQLAAGSAEDLILKRISLFNSGSVNRSYLTNFKLLNNGTQLASVAGIDSKDHITFDLANFNLEKGNTRTFEVYADLSAQARSSDTIKLSLEENTDLFATGNTFGFGAAVTRTAYDNGSNDGTDASWSTIEGGQLTVTFNGPAGKDVAKNAKDVEMFNFTLAAQSNLEVRNLRLTVAGTDLVCAIAGDGCAAATANLTDIKVIDTTTNQVVWGPQDLSVTGSDTSQSIVFTEDVLLGAGTAHTYKVTADVGNNAGQADSETFTMTLAAFVASTDVKNVDNNTFLAATDIVPAGVIAGNNMTTRISGLTLSLAGTPTSAQFVKGSATVYAAGIGFAASTAQSIKVTSISTTCIIDTDGSATPFSGSGTVGFETRDCSADVTSVKLMDGTTQIGDTKSPAVTTGLSQFNGLNWVIPAGTTKTLSIVISLSNAATATDDVKFGIAAVSTTSGNVTAVDTQDGNSVTVTYPASTGVNQSVTMSAGTTINITGAGTLSIANAPTELDVTDNRIVGAGTSGVTLAKIKFTAAGEQLKVTKLRVGLVSAAATAIVSDDVTSISLYDGATLVAGPVSLDTACASSTLHGCADFNSFTTDFIIPQDGNKTLTVKANLNSIATGADSGDEFNVVVDFDTNFEARGTSGNTLLVAASNGADISAAAVVLRKSQPKVEIVALPSTVLTNGTTVLQRFKVTAVDGDVALKHVSFSVTASDAAIDILNIALREFGAGANYTTTETGTTTAMTGGVTIDVTLDSEVQITAGTSKTFDFRADVTDATAGKTISTKILGDTAAVTGELDTPLAAAQAIDDLDDLAALLVGDVTSNDAAYNFIWSDMSGSGTGNPAHNDTVDTTDDTDQATASNDWTNGRYVKVVPTDTQTMTFPS